MAHAGRTEYDNREIVMKYIHYKLASAGLGGDAARMPLSAATGGDETDAPDPLQEALQVTGTGIGLVFAHRSGAGLGDCLQFNEENAQTTFLQVVDELFRDGVNWGRIVAFFEFGGVMCVESVNRGIPSLVDNIAAWMTDQLGGEVGLWIQENGGWHTFEHMINPPPERHRNRRCNIL
ncbi:vBcl-2 [Vespertilionid gammaherpesvirus 1]|uniref:VBcl-2 n=1 Tax=Vespertilionid gammaherpesvirus 1 TaxID=2560830 RepID=A0A109QG17_9GAMA|nr:vBcl-2 [Myotis gammaherpesvirus 8]AMA67357.1 vBcl-2 [Vespertilionid gammaherpesvirus 1]